MKQPMTPYFPFVRILLLVCAFAGAAGAQEAKTSVVTNSGYFKCKYGKIEIIDAAAHFTVIDEVDKTYDLDVTFCYKPMTPDDVAAVKAIGNLGGGLVLERSRTLKIDGFPGRICPVLFVKIGDWPIGKPPPASGKTMDHLYLNAGGGRSIGKNELSSGNVQWNIVRDGKQFLITGHLTGKATQDDGDIWEWDITFLARTANWSVGEFGLSPRAEISTNGPATNAK